MLEASGLGIHFPASGEHRGAVFFSSGKGGFGAARFPDSLSISQTVFSRLQSLKENSFAGLKKLSQFEENAQLQNLLSQFIEYQLERKIKSEKYL